jgi:hypothetical protein
VGNTFAGSIGAEWWQAIEYPPGALGSLLPPLRAEDAQQVSGTFIDIAFRKKFSLLCASHGEGKTY